MTTTLQRNHNNQMMPYEEALGGSGKEKLPCNNKELPAEPDSGKGSHLLRAVGE